MTRLNKVRSRTRNTGDLVSVEQIASSLANDNIRIAVQYVPTDKLIRPKRQLKKHDDKKIALLGASILENGLLRPILVDENFRIVAGCAVWMAATHIGLAQVPVVQVTHLSEEQLRIYAIADNQMVNSSPWNLEVLGDEFQDLGIISLGLPEGLKLELSGFTTSQIDDMIIGKGEPEVSKADKLQIGSSVCRAGDIYEMGPHRLICGDALQAETYATLMQGDRAQMVISDPPYNVPINGHVAGKGKFAEFAQASGEMSSAEFTQFLMFSFSNVAYVSVDGSVHYHFMDWRHIREIVDAGCSVYDEHKNVIVWDKGRASQGAFYRSQHELVFVFKKGKAPHINNFGLGETGRFRANVQCYKPPSNFARKSDPGQGGHPTIKSVAMFADFIRDCSKRGGIILDCFAGAGTTLLAAELTGRQARLIEIDPGYCDLAIRLWQKKTGKQAVLAATGQSFDTLAILRDADAPVDAESNNHADLTSDQGGNDV